MKQALHILAARETLCSGFVINTVACTNFTATDDPLFDLEDVAPDTKKGDVEEETKERQAKIDKMVKNISMIDHFNKAPPTNAT